MISTKKLKKLRKGKSLKDSSFNQVYRVNAIKGKKTRLTIQGNDAKYPQRSLRDLRRPNGTYNLQEPRGTHRD